MYGSWFDNLRPKRPESIMSIFQTENNCILRFMRLMKQHDIIAKDFVEIICLIESSINNNLLQKGGIGKFIFKDAQNNWFTVYRKQNMHKVHYLKYGFWTHFKEIFPDASQLYESKDILYSGSNKKYDPVVNRFHLSLKRISKTIDKNKFKEFEREENVWNMYAIPFEASSVQKLRGSVLKAAHHFPETNVLTVAHALVTSGVFVSLNYHSKVNKAEKGAPKPCRKTVDRTKPKDTFNMKSRSDVRFRRNSSTESNTPW
jgi:hypothetical protein